MEDRSCTDCSIDISDRHWRSKRCRSCQFECERQAMITKPKTTYPRDCGQCGKRFAATHKRMRYCSVRCGGKGGHPGNVTRDCVVCDKTFTVSVQFDKNTCSRRCLKWHKAHPTIKPIRNCHWCDASLAGKNFRAEWCDARCWHADDEGVSWDWIRNRRCVVCDIPIPRSVHYHRVTCSQLCRTRNRSEETLFRQKHARRRCMDQARIRRIPKSYIIKLRTLPCTYCGGPGGTADHVIPISRGGFHTEGNLVPACRSCNSSKRDLLLVEWRYGRTSTWSLAARHHLKMSKTQKDSCGTGVLVRAAQRSNGLQKAHSIAAKPNSASTSNPALLVDCAPILRSVRLDLVPVPTPI